MMTCCPISAEPSTRSGGADEYHGTGGPLGVDCAPRTSCTTLSWPARRNSAIRSTGTSTARARTGRARIRSPSAARGGVVPRSRICARRCGGPICGSRRTRTSRRVLFDGTARGRRGVPSRRRAPDRAGGARGAAAPGRSLRRNCCSSRAVGPARLLRGLDIPVVHDLPAVGENLQDHLNTRIIYRVRRPNTINEVAQPADAGAGGNRILLLRRGMLMTGGGAGRAVRAHADGAGLARRAVSVPRRQRTEGGRGDARLPRLHAGGNPVPAGEPRLAAHHGPDPPSRRRSAQYLVDADRPRDDAGRPAGIPAPVPDARCGAWWRGGNARPAGAER